MIAMNHAEIEELEITDRYLRGKLPPEDAARFEEHYLYCRECLDRLELAESMARRQGKKPLKQRARDAWKILRGR